MRKSLREANEETETSGAFLEEHKYDWSENIRRAYSEFKEAHHLDEFIRTQRITPEQIGSMGHAAQRFAGVVEEEIARA